MPYNSANQILNMTLITVCVDPVIHYAALDVAGNHEWQISDLCFEEYISAERRPHIGDHLKSGDGCVALIDFDRNTDRAEQSATYLQQIFPGKITVVAVAAEGQPDLLLRAMHTGCTEFLTSPVDGRGISNAFHRIEAQIANRAATGIVAGSILAFFGAKGGVGTTTIAIHLATFLVRHNKKKVLLIDAHAQFGHACIYLGVDGSSHHFAELVRNVNRLDSELLRGFVTAHPSGLDILSSPDSGPAAHSMHPDDVTSALEFLRTEYDFVLVDCAPSMNDINHAITASAALIYVVATPEISAVRDLSRYVDELVRMSDTAGKVKVAINRYSSQFAVSLQEIEKAIRLPVSFSIPNSFVDLVSAANLGDPLKPENPTGFCTEVRKWSESLAGRTPSAAEASAPMQARRNLRQSWQKIISKLLAPGVSPAQAEKRA